MNKPLLPFLIISAILTFYSCGAQSLTLSEKRYLHTGIDHKEAIVIILNDYNLHEENNASEDEEKALEKCLKDGMADEKPILKIIPAKDFRKNVYPGLKYEDAPRSQDALIDSLKDETIRNRINNLGLRYIVSVDIITKNSSKKWDMTGNQAGAAVGQEWTRYSNFEANVIDAKNQAKVGLIGQPSHGPAGWFLGVFIIVPVPGFWFSRTEADACSKLGMELHKFLVSNAEPDSGPTENESSDQIAEPDSIRESPSIQNRGCTDQHETEKQ